MTDANANVLRRAIAARPNVTRSNHVHTFIRNDSSVGTNGDSQQKPRKTTQINETPSKNRHLTHKAQETEISALESICLSRKTVDIRPLKAFVRANYQKDSAIYEVVVTDEDFLDAAEFSAKVGVFLKLSRRIKN
jgi:hypothetical protein